MRRLEQAGIAVLILAIVALPTAIRGWPTTVGGNVFTTALLASGLTLVWWRTLLLPKTSSAQVRRRARTRGGCRRGGRVFVCRGGPSCPGRRQVWATETAGVRSRSLGVGGVRCRTARTHGGRGAGWGRPRARNRCYHRSVSRSRPPAPGVRSGRPPARSLLGRAFSVGPPPNRTCPVKWHPALQCSSWVPRWASSVDVLVADTADDQGLAAAGSHPHGPFRWVLAPFGIEVLEGAHVVHLNLFG